MAVGAFMAGSLVAKMVLDKSKWDASVKGLEKDEKGMRGWASRNSASIKKMGTAFTVAGGAIVGSIGLMISQYTKAGDEVHKMALRTGFATETLSELKYAAEISGADINALEKGVKRMAKTITDANDGMATYQRAFERINVDYAELKNLGPEQQFESIAAAIAKVEDPTVRAATAQDIFGRAGTQLLPLFAAGVDGMEELRQKARELGVVYDQEAADKAARLADAQVSLKASVQGVALSLADTLVPAVSGIAEKISEIVGKFNQWAKENPVLSGTIVKVAAAAGGILTVAGPILMMIPRMIAGVQGLGRAFVWLASNPIGLVIAALGALAIGYLKVRDAQKKAEQSARNAEEANAKLMDKLKRSAEAAGVSAEEFDNLRRKYKDNAAAMAINIKRGKEGKKIQEGLTKVAKESKAAYDEHKKSLEVNVPALEDFTAGLTDAGNAAAAVTEKTKTWTDFLGDLGLKTIDEKKERVAVLEGYLENLHQAYKDGTIDLETYQAATKAASDEILDMATATETAIPPARDLGDVVGQAVDTMETKVGDFSATVKEKTTKALIDWGSFADGLRTKWSSTIGQVLSRSMTFKEGWAGIVDSMKTQFFDIVGQMISKFTVDFIGGALSGVKDLAGSLLSDIGGALSSIFTGGGGGGGGVAGDALTSLTGAAANFSPAGIIGNVAGGIVSGLASLVAGSKTKGAIDATNRELHNIWENTQHLVNAIVHNGIAIFEDIKKSGWTREKLLGSIQKVSWNHTKHLRSIDANANAAVKILRGLKGAQHGAVSTNTEMIVTHGTTGDPEITARSSQVENVMREIAEKNAVTAAAGKRAAGPITVQNIVKIDGQVITTDEYTRRELIPAIVRAMRANFKKTDLKRALEMA